jgi:hypothetical protein
MPLAAALHRRPAMTDVSAASEVNPFSSYSEPAEPAVPAAPNAAPVVRTEHQESLLTRMIEHQTAKIPSSYFLAASLSAMAVSLGAEIADRQRVSRFVGMWVGPLLMMGLYNKMVKMFGAR